MTNNKHNSNRLRKDEGTREKRNAHPPNLDDTTKPSVSSQVQVGNKDEPDEFEKFLREREEALTAINDDASNDLCVVLLEYKRLKPKLLNSACRHLSKRICDLSEENEKLKTEVKKNREEILKDYKKAENWDWDKVIKTYHADKEQIISEASKTFALEHAPCDNPNCVCHTERFREYWKDAGIEKRTFDKEKQKAQILNDLLNDEKAMNKAADWILNQRGRKGGKKSYYLRQARRILGICDNKNLVPHHIDGDWSNNNPENLMALEETDHRRLHAFQRHGKWGDGGWNKHKSKEEVRI